MDPNSSCDSTGTALTKVDVSLSLVTAYIFHCIVSTYSNTHTIPTHHHPPIDTMHRTSAGRFSVTPTADGSNSGESRTPPGLPSNHRKGKAITGFDKLIAENAIQIVSMSECCMCASVKRLLVSLGVNPVIFKVDEEEKTSVLIKLKLIMLIKPWELPTVYIRGKDLESVDKDLRHSPEVPLSRRLICQKFAIDRKGRSDLHGLGCLSWPGSRFELSQTWYQSTVHDPKSSLELGLCWDSMSCHFFGVLGLFVLVIPFEIGFRVHQFCSGFEDLVFCSYNQSIEISLGVLSLSISKSESLQLRFFSKSQDSSYDATDQPSDALEELSDYNSDAID
ncbi:hypothetical protein CQW23_04393 [Capsicum baccatum]|uniref:Glutaredoxin domain-containing protein n=1 Tax=Capsicum baccatum TaxID=33114 RepID=A0A2G2XEJ9_CAPBA|nr:hypothetical protein CQW23_04393 [Capsicum baccatum]